MITDSFLNNVASAITDNTFVTPSYLSVGTTVSTGILTTDTILVGEIGTRILLTKTVSGRQASYSATRTPANVITTATGDNLQTVGLNTAVTSGYLMQGIVIGGITHTTNFNFEVDTDVLIDRV
jgi:hypothetical protein